jgi:DNA invertase Pin-like site-specific DNA recombinase
LRLDALNVAGCERIFEEKASGRKEDRPGLGRVLEHAGRGDVLVVWKLDRFSRSKEIKEVLIASRADHSRIPSLRLSF